MHGGQFFCRDTCLPRKDQSSPPPASPENPQPREVPRLRVDQPKRPSRLSLVLSSAGIVIGLSALGMSLWTAWEVRSLRAQIKVFTRERAALIKLLKRKRRRQTASKTDTAATKADTSTPGTRSSPPTKPSPELLPRLNYKGRLPASFDNGSVKLKLVSLTFDGGSHCNAARAILDTLQSRDVHATMFLTGQFMHRFPGVVREIVKRGHEIGNHTYSHPRLTAWATDRRHTTLPQVSADMIRRELDHADRILRKLTGKRTVPLWRAPYGERNRQICLWGRRAGYLHVGWRQGRTWRQNLDSNDWVPDKETPGYHSPAEVYRKIMAAAKAQPYGINGGIVLMHLGTERKEREQQVHWILGRLIDDLRGLEYRFVPVSELVRASGIDLTHLTE